MDEIRDEGEGLGTGSEASLERETLGADPIDMFETAQEPNEDVEVEVVLLADDEVSGETEAAAGTETAASTPFRWYLLAPGVLAAAAAAALVIRQRSDRSAGEDAEAGRMIPVSPQMWSGTGDTLGRLMGSSQERTRALAARAQSMVGRTPPPPPPTPWEQAQLRAQEVAVENWATLSALAASIALMAAGSVLDAQRRRAAEQAQIAAPPPWYRYRFGR